MEFTMFVSTSALLITTRAELREAVALNTAGFKVTVRAPDRLALQVWSRAPAVLIDNYVAQAVTELGLPRRSSLHLLVDNGAQRHVWVNAVKLNVERVMVLPDAFPALKETVRAAGRDAPAVTVIAAPLDGRGHREAEGLRRLRGAGA
ncbi:hypothetical protein [Lentzea roselyniae]